MPICDDFRRFGCWFLLGFLCAPSAAARERPLNVESLPPSERSARGQFPLPDLLPEPLMPQFSPDTMRIVNLVRESVVDALEFRRICPTAAGGCIPWVDVAVALDSGDPEQGFGCRDVEGAWKGSIEVFVTGRVVLYGQASGQAPSFWPFRGHDQRVESTCTARAHEYGYHVEQSLEGALRELGRFLVLSYPSSDTCERYFLQAQRRAKTAFHKGLEQTRARESELHKVGWYPRRSRFGLGWKECP